MIRLLRDAWEIFAACVVAVVCMSFCLIVNCEDDQ
jgi:hypothetical protein